jgi:predicted GNAT family acetyltransferase
MTDSAVTIEVDDNQAEDRYEAREDGDLVGFARYARRGGRTLFLHTEVLPEREGEGIASALIGASLDAERAADRPVVPLCSFVRSYIERHPDYADLVDYSLLAAIDGD